MEDQKLKNVIRDVADMAQEFYNLAEALDAWDGFFEKRAQWWLNNAVGCVTVFKKQSLVVFIAGSLTASVMIIEKNSRSHRITFDSSDPESLFFIHDIFKSKLLEIL